MFTYLGCPQRQIQGTELRSGERKMNWQTAATTPSATEAFARQEPLFIADCYPLLLLGCCFGANTYTVFPWIGVPEKVDGCGVQSSHSHVAHCIQMGVRYGRVEQIWETHRCLDLLAVDRPLSCSFSSVGQMTPGLLIFTALRPKATQRRLSEGRSVRSST